MNTHVRRRLFVAAAILGAVALIAAGFFVAVGVRSVVAGPSADPVKPNPGHEWSEIGLPLGVWSGLDADTLDGEDSSDFAAAGSCWLLSGNASTTPGTDFVGTTDNQALELHVNGARALRLEPHATSPNVIGGYSANSVTSGAYGATIGGGGESASTNRVTDAQGTVGGGRDNQAGNANVDTGDAAYATVGGGFTNAASGRGAAVGGGDSNTASGSQSTVGGGGSNTASGEYATVGGGFTNAASGDWSPTVGGGSSNTATGDYATVGGGQSNTADNQYATVGGGSHNTVMSANYGTIAGGHANIAGADYSTVGGGYSNEATVTYATVGGGSDNTASGSWATVAGGGSNTASGHNATVSGGDTNAASGDTATVGGGGGNTANNEFATVGGGDTNAASGGHATVGGGDSNTASGEYATVGGGRDNIASGTYATVPGGYLNTAAGNVSFAAGYRAKANNAGCFVWGDSTNLDVACNTNNRFIARADGGVYLYSKGDLSTGVYMDNGDNAWTGVSDRNLKENFTPVDGQEVLASLAEMPITTWNLKDQDASIRHMGPVAQDFYAAFGLGRDELHISTVDPDGVALAAIQGLYELSQEQAERIDALEARVAALEGQAGLSDDSAGPLASIMPAGWLLLGGLVLGGLVLVQRRRAGGRP